MLVQVASNASACERTLVHSDVETVCARDLSNDPHCRLSQMSNFSNFSISRVGVIREVTVGADQDVSGVVRIQIEYDVRSLSAVNDMSLDVIALRQPAEGAVIYMGSRASLDVFNAVRRPETLPSFCHGQT